MWFRAAAGSFVVPSAVAGAKATFDAAAWPSTRMVTGQAWATVGAFAGLVQLAFPEKVITASLTLALVANEVKAVGM